MRAVVLACLVAACGSDGIDPGMSGQWRGTTTYSVNGLASFATAGVLDIAVSGSTATLARICPAGDGFVTVSGNGPDASWTGVYACDPVNVFTDCANVTAIYNAASVALVSGSTLTVRASGTTTGCGTTRGFTVAFDGNR